MGQQSQEIAAATERLIATQNLRVYEAWLAEQVVALGVVPGLEWAAARIAVVREGKPPIVLVLLGLPRRAWWWLGLWHLLSWWRARRALGKEQEGYLVRVRVL